MENSTTRTSIFGLVISALSFLASVGAVIVSIMGYNISKNSTYAKTQLIEPSSEYIVMDYFPCYFSSNRTSGVVFFTRNYQKFSLVNNGGKTTSLVTASYSVNGKNDSSITIFDLDPDNDISENKLTFPYVIEPGHAITFFLESIVSQGGGRVQTQVDTAINNIKNTTAHGVWILYFSDGTSIIVDRPIHYLDTELESMECPSNYN